MPFWISSFRWVFFQSKKHLKKFQWCEIITEHSQHCSRKQKAPFGISTLCFQTQNTKKKQHSQNFYFQAFGYSTVNARKCKQVDTELEMVRLHQLIEASQKLYKTNSTGSRDVFGECKASFKNVRSQKMKGKQRKQEALFWVYYPVS